MSISAEEALEALEDGQPVEPKDLPSLNVEVDSSGGSFQNLVLKNPLKPGDAETAFDVVYRMAGLNPAEYRIVEDTIKFSVWQQSARPKGGQPRDLITLYSYRAQFRRISAMDVKTEKIVSDISKLVEKRLKKNQRIPGTGLGPACSFTLLPSDWQLGKNEIRQQDLKHGKTGVEQTTWRVERAIDTSIKKITDARKAGMNVEGISIGFMGDPTENVADSYTNQSFIIELNLKDQMRVALDLMVLTCSELLPMAEKAQVFAVLCNHGQLTRRGTKTNVTDDADNVQNHLMELLKNYIIGPNMPEVEWYIPEQEMITTLNISGVPVAAAHGHKIPSGASGEFKWLAAQTANLTQKRKHTPRVWLTAHRHSHDEKDFGSFSRLQAATADGGSKHYEDSTAIYSIPGTSSVFIGGHDEAGYSDFQRL